MELNKFSLQNNIWVLLGGNSMVQSSGVEGSSNYTTNIDWKTTDEIEFYILTDWWRISFFELLMQANGSLTLNKSCSRFYYRSLFI